MKREMEAESAMHTLTLCFLDSPAITPSDESSISVFPSHPNSNGPWISQARES